MEILQVPFFIFLLVSPVCSKSSSRSPTCGNNTFYIQYPFHLEQENQNPHHPNSFSLQCNIQGITILRLPSSGDFYVRNIDYFGQRIQLYDPGDCLFERLMNFSLSDSPFYAVVYQNYSFFNCPTELVGSHNLSSIGCLSNSTASLVATSLVSTTEEIKNLTGCNVISSLHIPVSKIGQFEWEGFDGDLHLGWSIPNCDEDCKAITRRRSVVSIFIVLFLAGSIFVLGVLFCIGCCGRMPAESSEANHQTPHSYAYETPEIARIGERWAQSSRICEERARQNEFSNGFSTEELMVGGKQCISGPNSVSCPICLEEYQQLDRLRRICACGHCFHADCVETWFEKKPTCPVCRIIVIP